MDNFEDHKRRAIELLKRLIHIPAFSREEQQAASAISSHLAMAGATATMMKNNVFIQNKYFDSGKQTILLNSHHDTVKPNSAYTRDPFMPAEFEGKIYGLGSNDAGGCLVSLLETFLYFYDKPDLKYNLVFAATAEEEISGANGIEYALKHLPEISSAIVGEPTGMQMAIAEKGLLVLDCITKGVAGHAAREEGDNAIYKAMADIDFIRNFQFPKVSDLLGSVKMTVTSIETSNKAHNVVPAECSFILDVRINELYNHEEVISILQSKMQSEITPRSTRMRSTSISIDHPLVQSGLSLGLSTFGSSTTSDKALMPFPSLKIGPGDSARSHSADEFIFVEQVTQGIDIYISLLKQVLL